jgi:hypothetical protein
MNDNAALHPTPARNRSGQRNHLPQPWLTPSSVLSCSTHGPCTTYRNPGQRALGMPVQAPYPRTETPEKERTAIPGTG